MFITQDIFLDADVLRPLVAMLRRRNFNSKVQAAKAVESISYDNEDAQQLAEQQEVPEALCTMFQVRYMIFFVVLLSY